MLSRVATKNSRTCTCSAPTPNVYPGFCSSMRTLQHTQTHFLLRQQIRHGGHNRVDHRPAPAPRCLSQDARFVRVFTSVHRNRTGSLIINTEKDSGVVGRN